MNIETQTKLLRLKGILNEVSHASFTYARLQKDYPMNDLDEATAQKIISSFEQVLEDVNNTIMKYENTNNKNQNMD